VKKIKTLVFNRNQIDDTQWNNFISQSPQNIIYAYTWYLDVVCEEWIAIVSFNAQNEWLSVLPLPIYKNYTICRSYIPVFCQYLAVFYAPFQQKAAKELSIKKKLLTNTIDCIPSKIKLLKYNTCSYNTYLLPFFWKKYQLKVKYSYWLKIEKDKQINFRLFSHKTRTCINKAIKHGLICQPTNSIERIIEIGKRNIKVSFDENKLRILWKELSRKQLIDAVEVFDENGQHHCGIIYLKHNNKYIYLFGTVENKFKDLGGMSLAIWHIIKNSEAGIDLHDFQGSMLESIEKFYRGFGAEPVSYVQVYKNSLPLPLKILYKLYQNMRTIKPF